MGRLVSPSVFIAVLLILSLSIAAGQKGPDRMRVGVVEFREENQVGLENAGRIIAEWVASEIVRVGKFDVSEQLPEPRRWRGNRCTKNSGFANVAQNVQQLAQVGLISAYILI